MQQKDFLCDIINYNYISGLSQAVSLFIYMMLIAKCMLVSKLAYQKYKLMDYACN